MVHSGVKDSTSSPENDDMEHGIVLPVPTNSVLEFVVAHYNEDLSWLESFSHETTVYSKGSPPDGTGFREIIQLPNIGRESHTMLWHIVHRYDSLAKTTVFVQGDVKNSKGVRPHTDLSGSQMREKALKAGFGAAITLGSTENHKTFDMWDGIDWINDLENAHWLAKSGAELKMASLQPREFWQRSFGYDPPPSIVYAEAAFLAVTAETIRMRPLSFYEYLLAYLVDDNHVNPEFGHYLERFWGEVFSAQSIAKAKQGGF